MVLQPFRDEQLHQVYCMELGEEANELKSLLTDINELEVQMADKVFLLNAMGESKKAELEKLNSGK